MSKLDHLTKEMIRQKADAIGEEAEEEAHQEVSGALRLNCLSLASCRRAWRIPTASILRDARAGGLRAKQIGLV